MSLTRQSRSLVSRKSRGLLFDWRADPLATNLDALTGQVATYARAGSPNNATAVDHLGRIYPAVTNQPRYVWTDDMPGLLLEGARTNLVIQSDALTAANGWTLDAPAVVTAAYSTVGSLALSRITGAATGHVRRAVTLTGDGTKAFSAVVQFDGVAGTTRHALYDTTVPALRVEIIVTWSADGTATAAAGAAGTLLFFEPLVAGSYRIIAAAPSCVAANSHNVYAHLAGTASSVRVGGVQVENAVFPSSIIPTTTTTLTRAADSLSFAFAAAPQAMTVYVDLVDFGSSALATAGGAVFDIGSFSGTATTFIVYTGAGNYVIDVVGGAGEFTSVVTGATYGVRGEVRALLAATGVAQIGMSVADGAETLGSATAVNALGATFRLPILYLNTYGGAGAIGYAAYRALRIAVGVKTMAEMRAM